ncbi:MAG: LytTR family transcriptional regulator [Luteitalea sp.]|nr:LytTR family transcriptional regulator [Luteitalea sp.]
MRDPWLARIAVKEDEGLRFVPVDEILWIEAANKYVVLHTSHQRHVARETIQSLARHLDPSRFVRVHRSILVRKGAVRGLNPLFHGDYLLRLVDGTQLTLSRTFRDAFFTAMRR